MKTAVYIRCSTEEQNEASQRREISRYLKNHGIEGAEFFVDKASGDTLERPQFDRLQKLVFMGEVARIIVYKLDRVSRKLVDGITTVANWCKAGIEVVSVTQGIDLRAEMGQVIAAMLFGFAQMEQTTRRERQADGIAAAKERGVYAGRKPGATKAKASDAKRYRSRGWTDNEIAQQLGITRRTVQRYLHS